MGGTHAHYEWTSAGFDVLSLDALVEEFHTVVESATTTRFGVRTKASTEAWAFEIARRRIVGWS
ncbi:hypothetical protein [Actinokineospora terrae]|uniref:Uncharacterized protein n=1 Tax=Actinokineospora terrae TaxID=155974 RepID=A0A1H9QJH1_9PSEU|nr:hypothetical protein [Actinokineospora terrae]SER60604.1 hypothetical protein SAMN04487818_104308 [Actinokineospora terrae]